MSKFRMRNKQRRVDKLHSRMYTFISRYSLEFARDYYAHTIEVAPKTENYKENSAEWWRLERQYQRSRTDPKIVAQIKKVAGPLMDLEPAVGFLSSLAEIDSYLRSGQPGIHRRLDECQQLLYDIEMGRGLNKTSGLFPKQIERDENIDSTA